MNLSIPLSIGPIHFVGIGGIGMSGIAEILHNLGYTIQGSDIAHNSNIERLKSLGIQIIHTHSEENIKNAGVVVVSSAVNDDNPEVSGARKNVIPVVRRSEILAELMKVKPTISVAGTHGKTTTTSLIASILDAGNLDPTVINGGIINAYGTNAKLGSGPWIIAEADESDGTFVKIPTTIAVVTNLDPEHLEFYGSFSNLKSAFTTFMQSIPFYGTSIVCLDDPELKRLIVKISDRKIITFGLNPLADVVAQNIKYNRTGVTFEVLVSERVNGKKQTINNLILPMHGNYNICNALGAITVALVLGIDTSKILTSLRVFSGVQRRFTITGKVDNITIINDYGHHPKEIEAVLSGTRQATLGQVIAVVQPHRFSRVASLYQEFCNCFSSADHVIVSDIYSAGETAMVGIDRDHLISGIMKSGKTNVSPLENPNNLAAIINSIAKPGDFVICLGAGNISAWANKLPKELEEIRKSDPKI